MTIPMNTTIGAAKFKAQCLALLENVPAEGITITKHGRKLARLVPYQGGDAELIGCLNSKIQVSGDLLATGVGWDADDPSLRG
jgi:prevent-host-death family protein